MRKKSGLHKYFVLLAVCALLVAAVQALVSFRPLPVKNLGASGHTIVCFGDSLTFGYGVEEGESYPARLAALTGTEVINSGIDGNTSLDALGRIEEDVLRHDPKLVIIGFGGNDFLKQVPRDQSVSNIRAMIARVQEKGAMVAVLDVSAGFFLKDYRVAYEQLARESGAIFIPDAFHGILTNPSLKSDFVHPNARGYQLVAQRVYRSIVHYLYGAPQAARTSPAAAPSS